MRNIIALCVVLASSQTSRAQYGDISDLKILKREDKVHVKSTPPPAGAIVLFDGKNLDSWIKTNGKDAAAFTLLEDGAMQVKGGNIMTKQKFDGHFKLHVEFRVPYEPKGKGQGRGNSGVYVQGRYEVQVLDSYGLESKNNDCGAIYEVAAPRVNVCKAPTVWQSFDIEFTAAKCENGKKVSASVFTVHHNGVLIHDKVSVPMDNTRAGMGGDPCAPGPIMLQDHGNPAQFRNIWLVHLDRPVATAEPRSIDDYYLLIAKAKESRRPIVVWVGVKRPELEKDLAECLHIRLDAFPDVRATGIVVGVPAQGYLSRYDFAEAASLADIRSVLPRRAVKLPGR